MLFLDPHMCLVFDWEVQEGPVILVLHCSMTINPKAELVRVFMRNEATDETLHHRIIAMFTYLRVLHLYGPAHVFHKSQM